MIYQCQKMPLGDKISMKGPRGIITYKNPGILMRFVNETIEIFNYKSFGMIAGGSGITPILQVKKNRYYQIQA